MMKAKCYGMKDVAEYVIVHSIKTKHPISNLKLQFVLYFIQGFSYKYRGGEIMDGYMYLSKGGFIKTSVYFDWCAYGATPIYYPVKTFTTSIEKEDQVFLNDMVEWIAPYSLHALMKITKNAKGSPLKDLTAFRVIPQYKVKKFFKSL